MAAMAEGLPFEIDGVVAGIAESGLVAELLAEYGSYLVGQMATLKSAVSHGQATEVHRIAHAIHGGGLTLRAAALAQAAEKLEKVTTTGSPPEVAASVSELDAAVLAWLAALDGVRAGRPN